MPRIFSSERIIEYSVEFKIKVIKLTYEPDIKAIDIARVLNLHPMMIYRWRQEYREGKFIDTPSRRISMTKESATPQEDRQKGDEITRLKKKLVSLKKENDFLKKWDWYLKGQKKNNSGS